MGRKNQTKQLGLSLGSRKDRAKPRGNASNAARSEGFDRHVNDDSGRPQLVSVLESNDLEELMLNATLANADFTAERYPGPVAPQTVVVTPMGARTVTQRAELRRRQQQLDSTVLRVPRRPKWDKKTTGAELQECERIEFLEWRRNIAELEEELSRDDGSGGVMLTPFEKNLEVWRQLWRVVERSDVVIQIVDARNPLMYYCEDLKRYVTKEMRRAHILVLNKADLLPSSMIDRWQHYFADADVDAVFFSAFNASLSESAHDPRIIGAQQLIERLSISQRMAPQTRDNQRLVAGMCGYPNVGKSSTINVLLDTAASLAEASVADASGDDASMVESVAPSVVEGTAVAAKRVAVSSTPGRTKHFQTLVLTDDLLLCDCPGLVFPNFSASKAELICAGVLSIDQMRSETLIPIQLIARRIPAPIFEGVYGIRFTGERASLLDDGAVARRLAAGYADAVTLLETHARARGFMTDHNRPDVSRSARVVLKDYVSGRIRFAHAPPPREEADGEAGVGPDVFAKKGRLVIARREAAAKENLNVQAVQSDKGNPGIKHAAVINVEDKPKEVVARISQRKKHSHKQFTRVERKYSAVPHNDFL